MNLGVERVQELQKKIEKAKENKAMAEGKIQQIKEQWKEKYELNSEEEVSEKVKTLETEISSLEDKADILSKEIEEYEWPELNS